MRDVFHTQNRALVREAEKFARAVRAVSASGSQKHDSPYPRALLVGGFVRDALMGRVSEDLDIEVYGIPADQLQTLLEKLYPRKVNLIGQSFGIFHIALETGHELEVSLPRRDSKIAAGHKGFLIQGDPFMTEREAALRRDFTINAIMADPLTKELIDPFRGQEDLEKRMLRVTDPKRFQDDPLRVYRALQFTARFELLVEQISFNLMKEMARRGDLRELSKERVTAEIRKLLLRAPRPSLGFELAKNLGIIERDYPELFALEKTLQEPEWHPEGNVWIHTMMVIDEAARLMQDGARGLTENEKLQTIIGALCHDLGKPTTTALGEKDGVPRIRSIGHEAAGEAPTRTLLARWTFGEEIERAAVAIATQHLRPFAYQHSLAKGEMHWEQYRNAIRKLVKKISSLSLEVYLCAAEADMRGRGFLDAHTKAYEAGALVRKALQELTEIEGQAAFKPLVQGRDILERGLEPGPRVGQLIEKIEQARDEEKIKTRKEALAYLNELLGPSV